MIRRNWRSIFIFLALLTDAIAIAATGALAYYMRQFLPNVPYVDFNVMLLFTSYFGAILLFLGLVIGVYRASYHGDRRQQYFLAGKTYLYSWLIIFASLYILQKNFPPRFTFIFFMVLPFVFVFGRSLVNGFNLLMQKKGFGVQRALIVGYETEGVEVFERFTGFPELAYEIRGIVSNEKGNGSLQPHYAIQELPHVIKTERIDSIFIPSTKLVTNGHARVIDICRKHGVKLKILSPESDRLLRMNRVYDIAGITLYSPVRYRVDFLRTFVKRAFDIVGSFILIVCISPVFFVTGLAIWLEDGFPLIFKQGRTSIKDAKEFGFYKFRSMVKGAEKMKSDLLEFNESDGALFKMKNDPRLTKVGRVIRKFSIDELPQLFNVLKGDMSLVGPRPIPLTDFDKIGEEPEFWEAIKGRAKMKPGMTGLWQISGRSDLGFKEMLMLDFYYIENQSLLFDMEILFETIPVVLFGKGAY